MSEPVDIVPPGQQTLPGMADILGYETVVLKPTHEAFAWAYVYNRGNAVRAYKAIRPNCTDKSATSNAYRMMEVDGVPERIEQIKLIIGREWLMKIKDFHGRGVDFDPLLFYKPTISGQWVLREIQEIPEELRRLCTIDTRVVDKRLVPVLVPPDKYKSAAELAKMLGAYAPDKTELSGALSQSIVADIVFPEPAGEPGGDPQDAAGDPGGTASTAAQPDWEFDDGEEED